MIRHSKLLEYSRHKIVLIILMVINVTSCGIFKTHHKDKLIDFESNALPENSLKHHGYYYVELERDFSESDSPFIEKYVKTTGVTKIKYLSVFFFFQDGYVINIKGIDGLSHFYCAEKETYENTYQSAHKTIQLMLQFQNSTDKKTRRICDFNPNDIGNKGLVKIEGKNIKIQTYNIEYQSTPGAANSAYLYELNGNITSDSTFVITNEINFKLNKITPENAKFKFKQTKLKPNIYNYFKTNKKRFKKH